MSDPYVYKNTHVLINKFGITDGDFLDATERFFTVFREKQLRDNPIKGNFDYDHLKKIHGFIFQDVYDWAGQERIVNISKGGTVFCPVQSIQPFAESIFNDLKKQNYFKGLSQEVFAVKAAHLFSDINELHPFREGNGRTQREFMRELALNAGYELDLNKVPKKLMMDASIQGHYRLNYEFENIFKAHLKPLDRTKDIDFNLDR